MNDPDKPSPWGPRPRHGDTEKSGLYPQSGPKRLLSGFKNRSRFSIFVMGVLAFVAVLFLATWLIPEGLSVGQKTSGLLYDGILLAFVGAGLMAHVVSAPGRALRHLATWVIIFGLLAFGYSLWTGGGRLGGELNPARGVAEGTNISFRADISGHYFVRAEVNGVPIVFMVDTGATDVAITQKDAARIGLKVAELHYDMPYDTANGTAYGARVSLNSVEIGPIKVSNIKGSVLPEGLNFSLLGMSFLNRLSGYKVVDGVLTLYP